MTDTLLTVQKTTAVPTTPTTPNTVFLVGLPDKPDHMELYISSKDGTKLKRHINETDVKALITASMTSTSKYVIVDDINARNELQDKTSSVYVKNAIDDDTVNRGGAFYIYDEAGRTWIKISEAESLDISLDWDGLTGKPTSTPGAIDNAVTKAHEHANATQLDKIGEHGGKLTYGGVLVGTLINDAW